MQVTFNPGKENFLSLTSQAFVWERYAEYLWHLWQESLKVYFEIHNSSTDCDIFCAGGLNAQQ